MINAGLKSFELISFFDRVSTTVEYQNYNLSYDSGLCTCLR